MTDLTAKQAALRCAEIAAESLHRPTMPGGTVDAIRTYAATLPDDEGTVRVPVGFIEELLNDQHSDFRKSFGDRLRALLAAAKEGA